MEIKNCSECGIQPSVQSSEIGCIFRFVCKKCGKCTQDILSPTAKMGDPIDVETQERLTLEWNELN